MLIYLLLLSHSENKVYFKDHKVLCTYVLLLVVSHVQKVQIYLQYIYTRTELG